MLNKKELIRSLKKFSKFTVVSLAGLVLLGNSLNSTASAKATRHTHYSRRVSKRVSHHNKSMKISKANVYKYLTYLLKEQSRVDCDIDNEAMSNNCSKHLSNYYYHKSAKLSSLIYRLYNKCFTKLSIYQIRKLNKLDDDNGGIGLTRQNHILLKNNHYDDTGNELFDNTSRINHLSKQDDAFDTEVRDYLIQDINNTRKHYGLNPLIVTDAMQSTANYRNPRVMYAYEHYNNYKLYPHNTSNPSDNWVHGDDTHTSGFNYLKANHYSFHVWSANAGNDFRGTNSTNGDGTFLKYNNNTAKGFAGNINDGIINHDNCQGNHNGHRHTELNKNWKYLGVGVTYDNAAHMGSYNEQFAY